MAGWMFQHPLAAVVVLLCVMLGGFIFTHVVLPLALMWLTQRQDERDRRNEEIDLAKLHEMRSRGELSDEEFERVRGAVLASRPAQMQQEGKVGFEVIQKEKKAGE